MERLKVGSMEQLLDDVRRCTYCASELPFGPRPVVQAHADARILIVGQAPGRRVHESGIPFDDPSGERLRDWMGVGPALFYDPRRIAILPMGFCYPGTGPAGDLPPRSVCADLWRVPLLSHLRSVELTLIVGQYAQKYHMRVTARSVTENVRAWKQHIPHVLPLPHPSPRNNLWLRRNPWFVDDVIPWMRNRINGLIASNS